MTDRRPGLLRRMLRTDTAVAGLLPPGARPGWTLTLLAAILAFFAVLVLALGLAAERLALAWGDEFAGDATLQIVAEEAEMEGHARAALEVLRSTPGVRGVRMIEPAEQRALLAPWLGTGAALDDIPLPLLIGVETDPAALDREALALRLSVEAPGSIFDDHSAWRAPLAASAGRLHVFAWFCLGLVGLAFLAAAGLAARAAVAASGPDIRTLRLVGARDRLVARAFTRRFALRALAGAALGTAAGAVVVASLPVGSEPGFFLVGIGLRGWQWGLPPLVPLAALVMAWGVTARAARRELRKGS